MRRIGARQRDPGGTPRLPHLVVPLLAVAVACGATAAPRQSEASEDAYRVTEDLLDRGEELYRRNCVPCHGKEGKGDGPAAMALRPGPRDHTNRSYMDRLTDAEIAETIRFGGAPKGYYNMPSSGHLQGRDLAAVVAWVRGLSHGRAEIEGTEVEIR